jgi:hypothetical protein
MLRAPRQTTLRGSWTPRAANSSTLRGLPLVLTLALFVVGTLLAATAGADEGDPPTRVARIAYVEGAVSLQPAGTDEWVEAPLNRPLTTGDSLWSDVDGRMELQLDGSVLRGAAGTSMAFLDLDDQVTQVQLSSGSLLVRVRRLDDSETYEIDTPNLAFTILRPGLYRVSVDAAGNTTAIGVRNGQGEVTGGGFAYAVYANEYDTFSGGGDSLAETTQAYGADQDAFDAWSAGRDARWEHSVAARYVSADIVGYEDLDDQGSWTSTPGYGYVWFPRGIAVGWAPYHSGHWAYIAPWGYTWVDDQPWGFAPFHYGRWIFAQGAWGWVPAPPQIEGAVYVRPVYAPALVAWVGIGAGVAWFPLGPREVYVPSYPVSRSYVTQLNVSNTTVNTTIVNNTYNTTIINNKTVNVTNVTYMNRSVPGAVAATTTQAFTSAQPVRANVVAVDARAIATAPVQALTPAVVPTKQAVLGSGRAATVKPPAAVLARAVVARTAPPPPAPPLEQRLQAIKNNAGRPLSAAEVRAIPASPARRVAAVKIAPPATPVAARSDAARPVVRPPARAPMVDPAATRPPPTAAHANEIPAAPKPPSPSVANSALERQHLQEQQKLAAQQEAERQKIQQQQELEHARLAKQADDARQQELEQQHRLQTMQLAAQHAKEQQELLEKQQEQRRQQESQTKPPNKTEEHAPGAKPAPKPNPNPKP